MVSIFRKAGDPPVWCSVIRKLLVRENCDYFKQVLDCRVSGVPLITANGIAFAFVE
jgi:hypothetical protein